MDSRPKSTLHSRQNSTAATPVPNSETRSPKQPLLDPSPEITKSNAHYTLFIRLPFARNGFQDPPPVEWDAAKDEALWKIISGSPGKQLNWETLSGQFQVSLPFLLQQAAWLYERRFESMKAQLKKFGAGGVGGSASPSPSLPQGATAVVGGESMVRTRSKDSQKPAAINTQRNSPLPSGEGMSSPGTPRFARPTSSRTPSTTTVTQSRMFGSSSRPPPQALHRASDGTTRKHALSGQTFEPLQGQDEDSGLAHDGTSESESEDEPIAASRSRAFRMSAVSKRPVMASFSSEGDADNDDDDDDSGGFLPFAAASKPTKADPAATLRNSPAKQTVLPQQPTSKGKSRELPPDSSASSASSVPPPPSNNDSNNRQPALSPRHRAELEKLSPRYKKSGSEGSPSLGSSFSDLDDADVTQSALDDAVLSMQNQSMGLTLGAGMGSRISGLRDALSRR